MRGGEAFADKALSVKPCQVGWKTIRKQRLNNVPRLFDEPMDSANNRPHRLLPGTRRLPSSPMTSPPQTSALLGPGRTSFKTNPIEAPYGCSRSLRDLVNRSPCWLCSLIY